MNPEQYLHMQSKRGAKQTTTDKTARPFESVLTECRGYIDKNADSLESKSGTEKTKKIGELILSYLMQAKPLVEGFINADGTSDTQGLTQRLTQEITDYGILTDALENDDIFEIRDNGREIKVEIKGHVEDYRDPKTGHIVRFDSPEQQKTVIAKLLGDVRLTPKDAVVNARTVQGYRVAALHSSAQSKDPIDPSNDQYASFVLRKFKRNRMNLGDIVKSGTLSDNMARLLALSMSGSLTFFTVGPTSSGKTTTNQAILQATPPKQRVVLLQNPSEIDLRMRDSTGRIINDVLHLEAKDDIQNPLPTSPTMENLMKHILRLSPTFVCFGELRDNVEFQRGISIGLAGHPFNCTYHAEDSAGAIDRFLKAYIAASGEGIDTSMSTLTRLLNLIIVQKILPDGTRKILQISEVIGTDPNDSSKPIINDIYRYVIDEEPDLDDEGNVLRINGKHKRVGCLSEKIVHKLKIEGVATTRFDFLLKPPTADEVETYEGNYEMIIHYGLDKLREQKRMNALKKD